MQFDRRLGAPKRSPREQRQAEFQVIAAMNPCPCGYFGHFNSKCRCTPDAINRYRGKISGPLLDRIDIQIEVPAVPQLELAKAPKGESSTQIKARAEAAYARQLQRQDKPNAKLDVKEIDALCAPDEAGAELLRQAIAPARMGLSARAYHRILKVARTIAELAQSADIKTGHIAEAIQYRRMDKEH